MADIESRTVIDLRARSDEPAPSTLPVQLQWLRTSMNLGPTALLPERPLGEKNLEEGCVGCERQREATWAHRVGLDELELSQKHLVLRDDSMPR